MNAFSGWVLGSDSVNQYGDKASSVGSIVPVGDGTHANIGSLDLVVRGDKLGSVELMMQKLLKLVEIQVAD